jgi:hypothetical protein
MPSTTDHESPATMNGLDIPPGLTPPHHNAKYYIPLLFIIVHICTSFSLDFTFFFALFWIFLLAYGFDYQSLALDAHHASLSDMSASLASASTLNAETSQRVRSRLQTYKSGYEKAIARRDAAMTEHLAVEKLATKYQAELLECMTKRNEEYMQCRKLVNDSRLVYYKLIEKWQVHIIDELEKLVKKFKNVAMPKVKGVGPSKAKTNNLTGPLERMVLGLKKGMQITRGEIGVAEKIGECLDAKAEDVRELYGRVEKAEEVLESVKEKVLEGGVEIGGMEGWEDKLEVQMRRLDKYYQGMLSKGGEGEKAEGTDCVDKAGDLGVGKEKV